MENKTVNLTGEQNEEMARDLFNAAKLMIKEGEILYSYLKGRIAAETEVINLLTQTAQFSVNKEEGIE